MRTEEQVRKSLEHYRDLTQRAHHYWMENPTSLNYLNYTEYMAKRDALAWILGEFDGNPGHIESTGPLHTLFWPDYVKERHPE